MKIVCNNPYFEKTYITDRPIADWDNFLNHYFAGDEDVFIFTDNEGKLVTINPKNFASVEATDGSGSSRFGKRHEEVVPF